MSRPSQLSPAATAVLLLLMVGGAAAVGWYAARASHGGDAYDDSGQRIAATLSVAAALADDGGGGGGGYALADAVRAFQFPADHGPHADFRTEWWYFTGNLVSTAEEGAGRRFGYQLTVFRSAVAPADAPDRTSKWATRQLYMAHLAVTDVAGESFHAHQRYARGAAGLAGAVAAPLRVWVGDWQVASLDPDGDATFPLRLTAAAGDVALDLRLNAGKGVVLQGDRGLSRKGAGGASYYYSCPRLPTRGTVSVDGETYAVEGASWLDREWSSSLLGEGQEGWDWFAVQLDDGRDLVFYRIRGGGGPADRLGYAALVPAAGEADDPGTLRVLDVTGSSLLPVRHWRSPESGVRYPAGWRLLLPSEGLHLSLRPLLDDQELNLDFRYWEGAIRVEGTAGRRPVAGYGYAELTGYGDAGGLR